METKEKKECELCGGIFIQITDDPNLPGVIPLIMNQYCDKCTKALELKAKAVRLTEQEEWIKERDEILK